MIPSLQEHHRSEFNLNYTLSHVWDLYNSVVKKVMLAIGE